MAFSRGDDMGFSVRQLQDELNRVVERVWQGGPGAALMHGVGGGPAVDIYEFSDRYLLLADLPGVAGDRVDVTLLENELTIQGDVTNPLAGTVDGTPIRTERRTGTLRRVVDVPQGVDPERISARCQNGLLEVVLPKSTTASPRTVRVDTGTSSPAPETGGETNSGF
ncbi:MAG: Hsp20/alpha crystallin family protein [Phycisphaerae bacterium]